MPQIPEEPALPTPASPPPPRIPLADIGPAELRLLAPPPSGGPPASYAPLPVFSSAAAPPVLAAPASAEPPAEPPPPPYVVIPAPAPPPVVVVPELPPPPPAGPAGLALAGLESGILGALLMFGWFAVDSLVENQYWWAMLNLWGSALYGNAVFRMPLGKASLAGLALHVFLGGVAGALFGLAMGRIRRFGLVVLASLAAGVVWYGVLQLGILRTLNPLIGRMTPQPATLLAHLLYASVLTRIPRRATALASAWRELP